MYRIEIYYNKAGELTLSQYEENGKLVGRFHGIDVKNCLTAIKNEKINHVFPTKPNTATVIYDDAYINIHNVDKMEKDPLVKSYLKLIEDNILLKEEERAPTVTRQNKYRGPILLTATALLIIAVSSTMMGHTTFPEDIEEQSSYSITLQQDQPSIIPAEHNNVVVDTLAFKTSQIENNQPATEENYAFLYYNDRSSDDKHHTAAQLYWDTIEKYANMYGLDPELVLALATQERGVHSSVMDAGGATGLMQIQNSVWLGFSITAYNFENQAYETTQVTKDKIEDCDTNIKIGCMILQDTIRAKDYNILAGVLSYNMGGSNVNKILKKHAETNGLSYDEIIHNQNNCDWVKHCDIINVGDQQYLQHVLSYMGNDIETYVLKPDGERVEVSVKNYIADGKVTSK